MTCKTCRHYEPSTELRDWCGVHDMELPPNCCGCDDHEPKCATCNGTGRELLEKRARVIATFRECPDCGGEGRSTP